MPVIEIHKNDCLSSTEYDPSPNRFDSTGKSVTEKSQLPIVYKCQTCNYKLTFKEADFKKHTNVNFSNLNQIDRGEFMSQITMQEEESYLDFYCPSCNLPTTIIFTGGPTGYWGMFGFKIQKVLVIKK